MSVNLPRRYARLHARLLAWLEAEGIECDVSLNRNSHVDVTLFLGQRHCTFSATGTPSDFRSAANDFSDVKRKWRQLQEMENRK